MVNYLNEYVKNSLLKNINTPVELEHSKIILKTIYILANVDIKQKYINNTDFDKLVNQSVKVFLAPCISDIRNLCDLRKFDNIDILNSTNITDSDNIERYYKSVIERIVSENPNLLTLGENGIREDANGYLALNECINDFINKKNAEIKRNNSHITNFEILIEDRLNADEIENDIINKLLECYQHGNITTLKSVEDYKYIFNVSKKSSKKQRIIDYYEEHAKYTKINYKQIAEILNYSYEYVKKVLKNYKKLKNRDL